MLSVFPGRFRSGVRLTGARPSRWTDSAPTTHPEYALRCSSRSLVRTSKGDVREPILRMLGALLRTPGIPITIVGGGPGGRPPSDNGRTSRIDSGSTTLPGRAQCQLRTTRDPSVEETKDAGPVDLVFIGELLSLRCIDPTLATRR